MGLDEVCAHIISLLPLSENNLGFVSPTHFVPQMVNIVEELRRRGHNPTIIYNTNGYDLPETIHTLEWIVDVWLPDFKYSDDNLAEELSQTPDYSRYASASLKSHGSPGGHHSAYRRSWNRPSRHHHPPPRASRLCG